MACKQHSTDKKSRKRIKSLPSLTRRSEWACWMNGADPEWMGTPEAQRYARAFPDGMPQWLIQAEPWRQITGPRFRSLRRDVLGLSIAECAAYLNLSQAELKRWESDQTPVPVAAFEALRLHSESLFGRLSHRQWDGWFIHRQTGEFVSPDVGRLSLTPAELNTLPMMYADLRRLEQRNTEQVARIAELEAENTALRGGARVRAVATELEAMQDRIAGLLGALRTAEVIPFPAESTTQPMRATA